MNQFWDDDELLEKARALLTESPDDLKARLVAQAMRLQQEAATHLQTAADERARIMAVYGAYSPAVVRIADMLAKHPHMIEPVTQLMESSLRAMIDSLPSEEEP